jgi:hypothetical protein
VFNASVIKIQKHVCHETSGGAAEVPSGATEKSKRSLIMVSDFYVIASYVPMCVCSIPLRLRGNKRKRSRVHVEVQLNEKAMRGVLTRLIDRRSSQGHMAPVIPVPPGIISGILSRLS